MKNYNSLVFDQQRNWIYKARTRNIPWEQIYYGNGKNDSDLQSFLLNMETFAFWKNITVEDWKKIVDIEREGEEKRLNFSEAERNSIIGDYDEINGITSIPESVNSCWQKYRKSLLEEKHFLPEDVRAIQESSLKILKRLNSNTKGTPVKGLVVGNVQSGKTANMAALMAMAADHGWNMFIVLSGTIENLRLQTLKRLISDLNQDGCNLAWTGIARPSLKSSIEERTQNLHFESGNPNRYLTVTLKNSKRLEQLVEWLHEDPKSANQMKILVIDDESDQAGINTKPIEHDERTKINNLIINLISNRKAKGQPVTDCFASMNYIGYTATPYANVLNEASFESLYPRNFISTLQVSKTYFGPQQIFGDRNNGTYSGLDIVRIIDKKEVVTIKSIHNGEDYSMPKSLEQSLCWFLCCVAALRKREYKKPISMLVHTSQNIEHHDRIRELIQNWFERFSIEAILKKCETVWEYEVCRFTKDDLFRDYPEFAVPKSDVVDYPSFKDIKEEIQRLIASGAQNIQLGEEGEFTYTKGIHICVDNCDNNGIKSDGTYMRLAYPEKKLSIDYATAFIVIGGNTLSRGLTIEGLVSAFFLRSTKQGDTLMQMGRWFGYRREYELLQRIWMTENAIRQFEFLSDLDSELRACISQMEMFNKPPKDYAVVIKQSPSANLLRISAKNKMQSAISADMNYSGMRAQTHLFVEHYDALQHNYETVELFLKKIGKGEHGKGLGQHSYVWNNIEFKVIFDELLNKYQFHDKMVAFQNLASIQEWVEEMTKEEKLENWNVVLFGLAKGNKTEFAGYSINKVRRTRKTIRKGSDTIDLRIITDPIEKIIDVDPNYINDEHNQELYWKYVSRNERAIREAAGMSIVPSLIIYVIDKDSKKYRNKSDERDLNVNCDIIGLSLNIPGDKINENYTRSVQIDLEKFGLGIDIE